MPDPIDRPEAPEEAAPEWLRAALELSRVPEAVRLRSVQAASMAASIARMRVESDRAGFAPLSLSAYLDSLAKAAGVALEPVLAWFGVADPAAPTRETAFSLGRLAGQLGFSLREALALVRVTVAEGTGAPVAPLAIARRISGRAEVSELDACESALAEVEAAYPARLQGELSGILAEVSRAYSTEEV